MSDKRKAIRRSPSFEYVNEVTINGKRTRARVLDVSTGGMRIMVDEFMSPETEIFCKIDIFKDIQPFYVKGEVIRVIKKRDEWEVGVKFDTVRIHNFFDIKKT